MAKVQQAVKILEDALPGVGSGSDTGQAILSAIQKLSKIAPPMGAGSPGVGIEALRAILARAQQQAPLQALMRQQAAGGGAGGPPAEGAGPPAA